MYLWQPWPNYRFSSFFFWKFRSIFLPSGTQKDCCFNMSHRKWRKPSWNVHLTLIIRPFPISTVGNKTVVHWFPPRRVNGRSLFVWCNLQAKLHSFPCFNTASRLGREANKIHVQIRTTPQSTPVSNHICPNIIVLADQQLLFLFTPLLEIHTFRHPTKDVRSKHNGFSAPIRCWQVGKMLVPWPQS